MIDSYEKFLTKYVSKENFFEFGLSETIYIPLDKAVWSKVQHENIFIPTNNKKIVTSQGVVNDK